MAVDIDCTWHTCNMSRHCFDIQADSCCLSAKSLRSDSKFVYFLKHFFLKVCIKWIRILGIQWSHQCFLCKKRTFIKCTADTNANYHWRAWVRTCCLYYFKDKVLDSLQSCGWFEHTDLTHVLTSETFRSYCDLNFIARNDFCVNHSRCIVTCVSTAYRVFYYRFS